MNMAEQALETAQGVYLGHRKACKNGCGNYVHGRTSTLSAMCLHGVQLYKELLKCEEVIVKQEKSRQNAAEARNIRRENMKQMQNG